MRCCDWVQEFNDGKFFLQIVSLHEALNVFPPQNANQPPDLILKWACLCMSFAWSFLTKLLCTLQDCTERSLLWPHFCSSHKSYHWNPQMPARNLSIGKAKEFASMVFKEAKRIISYMQWFLPADIHPFLKRNGSNMCFTFLMLVTADSS